MCRTKRIINIQKTALTKVNITDRVQHILLELFEYTVENYEKSPSLLEQFRAVIISRRASIPSLML